MPNGIDRKKSFRRMLMSVHLLGDAQGARFRKGVYPSSAVSGSK